MGRLGATDAAPAQLLQLKFQGLAWGPWAGSFSPSPPSLPSNVEEEGPAASPTLGAVRTPRAAFLLFGRQSAVEAPRVWGLCAFKLPFPLGFGG